MSVRYGDNIFEIGACVGLTLRMAGWPKKQIDGIYAEIHSTKTYDDAIAVCRRYITIKDEDG